MLDSVGSCFSASLVLALRLHDCIALASLIASPSLSRYLLSIARVGQIDSVQRPTLLLSSRSRPTEKLELPSISQVHTRGPAEIPWYNHHAAERPLLSGDKLPALSLPTAQPYRSHYPDLPASNPSSARTSLSGPAHDKTPPPPSDLAAPADYLPPNTSDSYYPPPTALSSSMNHTPPYMDVHSSHLSSAAQPYASQAAPAGGIPHYSPYSQQPPVLQPASTTYGPASSYSQYGYPGSVASPQSAPQPPPTSMSSQMPAQLLPLPGKPLPPPSPDPLFASRPLIV